MLSSGRQLLIRDSAQRQHATHVSDLFDPTTCRDGRMKVDLLCECLSAGRHGGSSLAVCLLVCAKCK